jgi:hypothetical protein
MFLAFGTAADESRMESRWRKSSPCKVEDRIGGCISLSWYCGCSFGSVVDLGILYHIISYHTILHFWIPAEFLDMSRVDTFALLQATDMIMKGLEDAGFV